MYKQKFKKLENDLLSSLLYSMSLGSHELFHSNVWSWLLNYNKEFVKIFFPKVKKDAISKITREEGNRDITIWAEGKAYVIENKFKSIPEEEQLNKYQRTLGNKFAEGCVTGIIKPHWIETKSSWSFISYKDLSINTNLSFAYL